MRGGATLALLTVLGAGGFPHPGTGTGSAPLRGAALRVRARRGSSRQPRSSSARAITGGPTARWMSRRAATAGLRAPHRRPGGDPRVFRTDHQYPGGIGHGGNDHRSQDRPPLRADRPDRPARRSHSHLRGSVHRLEHRRPDHHRQRREAGLCGDRRHQRRNGHRGGRRTPRFWRPVGWSVAPREFSRPRRFGADRPSMHFEALTWRQLVRRGSIGSITVGSDELGLPGDSLAVDLRFAILDPPAIGRNLLGDRFYDVVRERLERRGQRALHRWRWRAFVQGRRVRARRDLRSVPARAGREDLRLRGPRLHQPSQAGGRMGLRSCAKVASSSSMPSSIRRAPGPSSSPCRIGSRTREPYATFLADYRLPSRSSSSPSCPSGRRAGWR